jgi:hypothetical protein
VILVLASFVHSDCDGQLPWLLDQLLRFLALLYVLESTGVNLPSLVSELVQCSYSLNKDVLSEGAPRVSYRLNGGLILSNDGILTGTVRSYVDIECELEC